MRSTCRQESRTTGNVIATAHAWLPCQSVHAPRYMRMATKRNVNDWRRQQEQARTQTLGLTSAKHDMVSARLSSLIKVFCQLYRNKHHTFTSMHASISSLVFVCVLVGLGGWVVAYRELQMLFAQLQLFGQNYHHLFPDSFVFLEKL